MFPITITLTFSSLAELLAYQESLAALQGTPSPALTGSNDKKDIVTQMSAPDPKPQAEKTAPAAPTPKAAATPPSAATAPTAAPAADKPVDYSALAGAVLKLMKLDPAAPAPIAKALGFDTFKLMKEAENASELFAKALPLVQAKIAELEAV